MADYNPEEESVYLMYIQYLPYAAIKWVDDVNQLNYNVPDNNEIGYILEVALEYPESIHDKHKDLPMAPTKAAPTNSKESKILATLCNKNKYVLHYRSLKKYVGEGLI